MLTNSRRFAAALGLSLAVAARAGAQQSYPQTLYFGEGLIDIPVAWISPVSGDFALSFSGVTFRNTAASPQYGALNGLNTNGAAEFSFFGRVGIGIAFYSDNPEWGFFFSGLLLDQEQFRHKTGSIRWMPSVAVGLRNVGPYDHIDRYTIGYDLTRDPATGSITDKVDTLHHNFKTGETVYGVVTKSFALNEIKPDWSNTNLSFSVGFGNGLFKDDGGLGQIYNQHSWGGFFAGVKADFFPAKNTQVSVMAENNAWSYNLGSYIEWRGLRASVYWLDIGQSQSDTVTTPGAKNIYGYSKFAFSLGWSSNVLGLVHGDLLQKKVDELEAERNQLQAEIAQRQQRIVALQLEINRYEAQNLLELEQRRSQAETELRSEREALQKLEDRLKRLEQNAPPGTTPPQ